MNRLPHFSVLKAVQSNGIYARWHYLHRYLYPGSGAVFSARLADCSAVLEYYGKGVCKKREDILMAGKKQGRFAGKIHNAIGTSVVVIGTMLVLLHFVKEIRSNAAWLFFYYH